MDTDFRKLFESPGSMPDAATTMRAVADPAATSQTVQEAEDQAEDAKAVTFPLKWVSRFAQYLVVAGMFGFVAHTAFTGDPEKDFWKILLGCGGVLAGLVFLPGSIVLDRRGIHQLYLMGLYEYTIPQQSILSYQQTTRAELRREGKLWFSGFSRYRQDRDGEFEQVVFVASRYGGRYILHSHMHRGQHAFMEELEKRGVPAHGYEGWSQFMAERGFPPADGPSADGRV